MWRAGFRGFVLGIHFVSTTFVIVVISMLLF